MANIYCHGEPGSFPDTEFRRDEKGQLKEPYIHDSGTPHYVNGEPIHPGGGGHGGWGGLGIPAVPLGPRSDS